MKKVLKACIITVASISVGSLSASEACFEGFRSHVQEEPNYVEAAKRLAREAEKNADAFPAEIMELLKAAQNELSPEQKVPAYTDPAAWGMFEAYTQR